MYTSFMGGSRRPRNVNLSNRSGNPLSGSAKRQHPSSHGSQSTIAIAQQERQERQLERDRLTASRLIQRVWRGHISRTLTRSLWRNEWDLVEHERRTGHQLGPEAEGTLYSDLSVCIKQLRLLLQFINIHDLQDVARLGYFSKCLQVTLEGTQSLSPKKGWVTALPQLMMVALDVLAMSPPSQAYPFVMDDLLQLLIFLTKLIPKMMARRARRFYTVLGEVTKQYPNIKNDSVITRDRLIEAVLAPLQLFTSETLEAYYWFALMYLTIPSLQECIGSLDKIATSVNYKLLASALDSRALQYQEFLLQDQAEKRIWLLAYFIYIHRTALGGNAANYIPEVLFVKVASFLLSSASTEISQRHEIEEISDGADEDDDPNGRLQKLKPLPLFVRNELLTLINQNSITLLLTRVGTGSKRSTKEDAKNLATYALTLLRIFPKRGDEIRMWLYLGSAAAQVYASPKASRLPAIKYFGHASKSTSVYRTIVSNPKDALSMLRLPSVAASTSSEREHLIRRRDREQEWTVILLFLELYTFLLKVLDDDEFFLAGQSIPGSDKQFNSWTKESALPLDDVKELTIFLKNLAFTLYWNTADLTASEDKPIGMREYFSPSSDALRAASSSDSKKSRTKGLEGVAGIPLQYFKGLVTGLLRMIHERDSRRRFLPEGHWLMTDRFDMTGFVSAVVAEEENRHQLEESEENESELGDEDMEEPLESSLGLVGTGRAQQVRHMELLKKRQEQAARRKELEAVAPRLEILRNMPFTLPFNTRVQIFREFIFRDQVRRRRGLVNADEWRVAMAQQGGMSLTDQGQLRSQHHADIRRENLFEDAFEQFYSLGEALKEPIQITFIDKFNTIEAGIDGGGVTKEFLTSIISDAFKPSATSGLFVENDQHLLYPNPASVEQHRYLMRDANIPERGEEWNFQIRELLRKYEFLGRIIGKCLYEGILVDVSFAGFFLLKWALTGGSGSATRESAYRANLNDIQDLDKGLYQGLLQLKNYEGNVEDFSLNFTVTDTVPILDENGNEKRHMVTQDLKPNGSNISVTNQNRLVYLSYIARHRLQVQPFLQTNAFLMGLGQIIQPSWLSMFNQAELQRLVGGDAVEIDVDDLRRNTVYSGVYLIGDDEEEHPTVKLFWEVLRAMTNEERQKVLKFVTSTPRAPLLGFSHLNPRFSIRDSSNDEDRLPSTSTCANLLKLPRYTNAQTLREKLIYAVDSGAGFDLS
ncbi:hypothetical protein FQN57_007448 [Myotisia sp. PD_48]|nr:hypothetical protein FQN57_007448 [Myotisia sp. PD_48]